MWVCGALVVVVVVGEGIMRHYDPARPPTFFLVISQSAAPHRQLTTIERRSPQLIKLPAKLSVSKAGLINLLVYPNLLH